MKKTDLLRLLENICLEYKNTDIGNILNHYLLIIREHDDARVYTDTANYLYDLNLSNDAELFYQAAILADPELAEPYYNLGNIMLNRGNFAQARVYFEKMTEIDSGIPEAYYNLGLVFINLGIHRSAAENFRKASALAPGWSEADYNLALSLIELKEFAEAEVYLKKLVNIYPEPFALKLRLAEVLAELKKSREAIRLLEELIELNPRVYTSFFTLGKIYLQEFKEHDKALFYLGKAYELFPAGKNINAMLGYCYLEMADIDKASLHLNKAVEMPPRQHSIISDLLLFSLYTGLDNQKKNSLFNLFNEALTGEPSVEISKKITENKKIVIGYVSADFYHHVCYFFIESFLLNHDKEKFEIICYSNIEKEDAVTEQVKKLADKYVSIYALNDDEAASVIAGDKVNILVDLSGHTKGSRFGVFRRKPAPVQVTWLGYPGSTGMETIDYRISDYYLTPEDTEEYYTEKLWRLKIPSHCYSSSHDFEPELTPPPFHKNGYITFGSFNKTVKLSPELLELWAQILVFIPDSRLVIKHQSIRPEVCVRLFEFFKKYDVDPDRVEFIGRIKDFNDNLYFYSKADIALDSFPYNGATTTMESLWMGVPVITLAGTSTSSRYGYSFLEPLGLPELVSFSGQEYVNAACRLASDPEKLIYLRANLREMLKKSVLMDGKRFTSALEEAYEGMWENYRNEVSD